MKTGISLFLVLFSLLCLSCVNEDSYLSIDEEFLVIQDTVTSSNELQNLWTYEQMKHHYYWNNEMPDSLSLDFKQEPMNFFQELLSDKDRFSWCEINYNYNTRGVNIGSTVSFDSVYEFHGKNVGYAIYDEFNKNADIRSFAVRMKKANIDELILDLRYNPGGLVSTCAELASFIVPTEHLGKLYQQQHYNENLTKIKAEENNNSGVDSVYLRSGRWYELWGFNLKRLIVLATEQTASASEALVVGLRPYMDVVIVGTQTRGKDVGSYTISDDDYKYQLQPITFKYYNSKMESTPETGLVPDVFAEDDKKVKRGDIEETLLKTALEYIKNNPLDNN